MPEASENDVIVRVANSTSAPLTLVLEPWATEYEIAANETLDIIETGGLATGVLQVEIDVGRVTLFSRVRGNMTIAGRER